jgi:HCOMODA/2-hydroxy-3-carboxy-muconic semialdehyde decarboxylase
VFYAIYLEANARMQAEALRLGPVTFLTEKEAALSAAVTDNQAVRAWNLWKLEISKAR